MIFYIKIKFPVDNPTDTLALNNKVTLSQKCFCSGFKQNLG